MGTMWRGFVGWVVKIFTLAIFLVVSLFILTCAGLFFPVDVAVTLCLGWILYLPVLGHHRFINAPSVAIGALCLATFGAGLHILLGRLFRSKPDERWVWRWTGSIASIIVLLNVEGLAMVGVTSEVARLLISTKVWTTPTEERGRQATLRIRSVNNLKQIVLALHSYHDDHKTFPPAATFDRTGQPLHGWMTASLPCLEATAIYNAINLRIPWSDPANAAAYREVVPAFLNPWLSLEFARDDRGYGLSHYAGNAHVLGGDRAWKLEEIRDGTSQTILAGEAAGNFKPWGDPVSWRDLALGINKSPDGFGGPFPGGANFAFADGSVRFIKETIDPRILKALGTPDGGEVIGADEY